jgi:nicotinamidase-related amidase
MDTPIAGPAGLTGQLREAMPIRLEPLALGDRGTGLVIVDEVNGFATVGAGYLAPPVENPQVTRMVAETDRLARAFSARGWPIFAFLDTHVPGKPEPPYPPHCEAGTGEENLVPQLAWLQDDPHTTLQRKDCINGFVGSIAPDGGNRIVDWVNRHRLESILVVGICTDICVMDFVLTMLSARNHDLMPTLKDILVYESGCSTYDLPRETAEKLGLGAAAAHPQEATHYMGLYFMASRGARLVDRVEVPAG